MGNMRADGTARYIWLLKFSMLFALLFVQYASLLHAIEHPFHAHEQHSGHEHHQHHTHEHAHETHDVFIDPALASIFDTTQHQDEQQLSEFNCDVFFAGERLSHITLHIALNTPEHVTNTQYAVIQVRTAPQPHTLLPRSRSPPALFA